MLQNAQGITIRKDVMMWCDAVTSTIFPRSRDDQQRLEPSYKGHPIFYISAYIELLFFPL